LRRLLPKKSGVSSAIVLKQGVGEHSDIAQAYMPRQTICVRPNLHGDVQLAAVGEVKKNINVGLHVRRNNFVENFGGSGHDAKTAGKSFSTPLGIKLQRFSEFQQGARNFILSKQKVAVTPMDVCRERIDAFCFEVGRAGFAGVARFLVVRRKIQKRTDGMRVERARDEKRVERGARIGLLEVVLIGAAEQIPIASIARFETDGALVSGASIEADGVSGASAADAEISKKAKYGEREEKHAARRADGKFDDHGS